MESDVSWKIIIVSFKIIWLWRGKVVKDYICNIFYIYKPGSPNWVLLVNLSVVTMFDTNWVLLGNLSVVTMFDTNWVLLGNLSVVTMFDIRRQ